jgi:hypothetical protein
MHARQKLIEGEVSRDLSAAPGVKKPDQILVAKLIAIRLKTDQISSCAVYDRAALKMGQVSTSKNAL